MPEDAPYYTPARLDSLLRDWPALTSEAESPSAPQYVSSGAQPAKGGFKDRKRAAVIVADVERSMLVLRVWSLEWNLIDHVRRGYSFDRICEALHIGKQTAHSGYWLAVERMAVALGWEPPKEAEV